MIRQASTRPRCATLPFCDRAICVPRAKYLPSKNRGIPVPKEPKTIGEYLRRRRLELGILQAEAARRLGVNTVTLSRWECDKVCPTWPHQPRVTAYLGYDPFTNPALGSPPERGDLGFHRPFARSARAHDAGTAGPHSHNRATRSASAQGQRGGSPMENDHRIGAPASLGPIAQFSL